MSRKTTIRCDECGQEITTHYVSLHSQHIGVYATWEGARDSWDFCKKDCLLSWLTQQVRPGDDYSAATRARLAEQSTTANERTGSDV